MIAEIVELGFSWIELSHGMTVAKLPGIRRAFEAGMFRCAGVHNFFPSPVEVMIDAPDAYEFTSHRAPDRQRAMEMTKRTIELAGEFRARYVVLHMGSVPMRPVKWTKVLTEMVREGEGRSSAFVKHKLAMVKKREKLGPLYFQRAMSALEELVPFAEAAGVKLAVESRSRYEDVPTEREMLRLQEHFGDSPWVGYWHDFGHVQLKHNLGITDHGQWLETVSPHVYGGHVHDVEWPARDHRVPFSGELAYAGLLRWFPEDCPLVWELSPTREAVEIRSALERWRREFPERV
jgi:sugar phosphate isomerase/epimerase